MYYEKYSKFNNKILLSKKNKLEEKRKKYIILSSLYSSTTAGIIVISCFTFGIVLIPTTCLSTFGTIDNIDKVIKINQKIEIIKKILEMKKNNSK